MVAVALLVGCASMELATKNGEKLVTSDERVRLGGIYETRGQVDLALREYLAAIELDGTNPAARFAAGSLYLRMRDFNKAREQLEIAVTLSPTYGFYRNNLAWVYMEQGNLLRAEQEINHAMNLDPSRKFIYFDTLGMINFRGGKYLDAERYFRESIKLMPAGERAGLIEVYTHLYELYNATGQVQKALEAREKIKDLRTRP